MSNKALTSDGDIFFKLKVYGLDGQGETPAPATEEVGFVRRAADTVADVRDHVYSGMVGSVEGIVDSLVLGPIGAVGGLFSSRFAETMKKAIAYNVTDDFIMDKFKEGTRHSYLTKWIGEKSGEYSYLKDDGTVNNVARGIGGMLPAVAVSVATMGAATPAAVGGTAASAGGSAMTAAQAAKLAQGLSTAAMAAGAAGQASQEAYRDGAGFYAGQAYGALRGATEAATEYALGGTTKLITGGGRAMLPAVRKSVASTGVKRVVKAALEEGLEEGISEGLDPLTRTTYKGKEALNEYMDPAFYRRVLEATKDGTLTGLVFQGTVGHAMGNTGKAADMQEIRSELDTLKQKKRNLGKNNKLTDEAAAAIGEAERENYRVMETVLKKATPEKRAALMEDYGLTGQFSEDGSMTAEFSAELDRRATVRADGLDRRTASVEADAGQVQKVLEKEGRTQFTDVDGLSKEARKNLRDVKRVMDVFYDISDGAVGNFVVANESVADNAYYDGETGYIVIGADALKNGVNMTRKGVQSWFQTVLHEAAHGTEGTDSHIVLSGILKHIADGKYYTEMLKQLSARGYWNGKASDIRAEAEKIIRKVERGEALTEKQAALADVIASEGASIMAELALGNEHFARELLDADASIVEKLLNRIAEVKEALARRKDLEAKKAFEELRAAEGYFLEALAEKGMAFVDGKIIGADEDEDEVKKPKGIDKKGTVQYNKTHKSVYKQISKREYAVLSSEVTRKRAEYQSRGETVPRYDCGYTDGYFYLYENLLDYHFGVVKQIVIKPETVDFIRKVERWVEQNARTDENARTVDRIIAGLRREKRHNSGRASDGEHGRSNYGADRVYGSEQASNGGRNNRGSGSDQRDGGVKKSLKGIAADGKRIYESNFPKGTPKAAKSERILDYIKNVWSKKPIPLVISNGEKSRTIYAQFDPTIDETQNTPSDASKLAGGNRHGTGSEKRVTLDLADDYYDIASSATYNYSKLETGKDLVTHNDVIMWHYFVEDIYFSEYGSNDITPYTVTINVKEKADGNYVYSFNAEKESSTRRTLHADVNTRKGANGELFLDDSIHDSEPIVKTSDEISSEYYSGEVKKSRKTTSQSAGKSYRYYRSPQKVMSAWGHAMFVDDPYSSENYGDYAFGVEHSELVEIDELREEILAKMAEDYENGVLPEDMEFAIDQNGMSFAELADEYAPEDIVMSAQGWDNGQFVEWFYNRIIEPKDIKGIKTPDGAIVFDESIILRETDFDHGTAVKKSRKSTAKPVDNLPTEAKLKGQVRELTAAELERELNEAGLVLTSKDNNKNNLRIGRYISDHYPELSGRVKFFNNKATGRVTVQKIETDEDVEAARRTREAAERVAERQRAQKRFFERVKTPSGNDNLYESVEKYLERSGIAERYDAYVERSRSTVSSLSFYVRYSTDDGETFGTIKISDHNTIWQEMSYRNDGFIDLHEIASFGEVQARIKEIITRSETKNIRHSRKSTAKPPETAHLTAMQKQTVANYTRAKVYTKPEALQVVEDMARMLDESYGFDGGIGEASGFVTLTKAVKEDAARQLWQAYNTAKTDAERREIAADKDKNGKVIAEAKKRKVEDCVESLKLRAAQKFIIMGALGYKNKLGEAKVQAYVNGLGLSRSEREALKGYSGYWNFNAVSTFCFNKRY